MKIKILVGVMAVLLLIGVPIGKAAYDYYTAFPSYKQSYSTVLFNKQDKTAWEGDCGSKYCVKYDDCSGSDFFLDWQCWSSGRACEKYDYNYTYKMGKSGKGWFDNNCDKSRNVELYLSQPQEVVIKQISKTSLKKMKKPAFAEYLRGWFRNMLPFALPSWKKPERVTFTATTVCDNQKINKYENAFSVNEGGSRSLSFTVTGLPTGSECTTKMKLSGSEVSEGVRKLGTTVPPSRGW